MSNEWEKKESFSKDKITHTSIQPTLWLEKSSSSFPSVHVNCESWIHMKCPFNTTFACFFFPPIFNLLLAIRILFAWFFLPVKIYFWWIHFFLFFFYSNLANYFVVIVVVIVLVCHRFFHLVTIIKIYDFQWQLFSLQQNLLCPFFPFCLITNFELKA